MEETGEKKENKGEEKKEDEKKKVQKIARSYYSRKDIQQAIYDFCKNRETIPRYLEGFGKRPDCLDYPDDILNYAKKGATSFHCSEELWTEPLSISTEMSPADYNNIRKGWDFLIDIDSKYLDYSKIAAKLIIQALEYHGVHGIGIKFSGSKGMHILIPCKAFPEEVNGIKTKDMFPEWARLIAGYVNEIIQEKLTKEILKISGKQELEKKGNKMFEMIHKPSNQPAIIQKSTRYLCENCRTEMHSMKDAEKMPCPSCKYDMKKISEEEFYASPDGKDNSNKNPDNFEKKASAKSVIDSVDLVLVAPRHLFRTPYSLHEKTALASIVLEKNEIENFQPSDADALKVVVKNYSPECDFEEAKELLISALDWAEQKNLKKAKKFEGKAVSLKGLKITPDMFPECIKILLNGMKGDGRKRALSLLLSFFSSLEMPRDYMESEIEKWNKKNYKPLSEGYIKSQISWYAKNPRLPQNYDKPIYRELSLPVEAGVKNPINSTVRMAMLSRKKKKQDATEQ